MIEKLTKDQENLLSVYRDRYIKIGLSTETIDREKCQKISDKIYKEILNKKSVPVFFAESPLQAWCMVLYLNNNDQVRDQFNAQVLAQVRDQVNDQAWNQVFDQVLNQVKSQVNDFVWPYIDGNFFSSFFSFYDYMDEILNIKLNKKYYIYKEILNFSLFYPLDKFCVICDRPKKIKMKNGKLHNENGASILYRDGFSVFSLNGVRVPEWVVKTKKEDIKIEQILNEKNAEIRKETIKKVGIEDFIRKIPENNLKILDIKNNYELLEIKEIFQTDRKYLKMLNPSTGNFHIEGVHPDCTDVNSSLAWRNGLEKWKEPIVLT